MNEKNKPAERDIVQCAVCGRDVVWMPSAFGHWVIVDAEPTSEMFRPPFAGELKYVHQQHQLHFCQERPGETF